MSYFDPYNWNPFDYNVVQPSSPSHNSSTGSNFHPYDQPANVEYYHQYPPANVDYYNYNPYNNLPANMNYNEPTYQYHNQPYVYRKTLSYNDVSSASYLLISDDFYVNHVMPYLGAGRASNICNGIKINIYDTDRGYEYKSKLIYDARQNSYYITKNWYSSFVLERDLGEGTEIGLSWDDVHDRFNFTI
ncbi:hypothetical protein ACFE04_025137 [Oxalis oulophora]